MLSGVSVDYYTRLEQGRERSPSPGVLSAICRAVQLDAGARAHLFRVAGLHPDASVPAVHEQVHPELLRLLDAFPGSAAYVLGPAFDVLATNAVAAQLLSPFPGETNMVRILFRHPLAPTVFADWQVLTENVVYALRSHAGQFPSDARITALVEELAAGSRHFRALWADQGVRELARMAKVFVHPEVGRVELGYQVFDVREAPGQVLLVGTPVPGTPSARAIADLGARRLPA